MNGLKFCCKLSLGFMLAISPAMVAQSAPALPDISTAGAMGEEIFRNSGSTGMVMVVVRDKEVYFHGYGETAPGSHQTPTLDSVVRLCSLTKIFTTDLLSKLAADRTVHLDDTLQKFAPKGVTVPKREESIRLVDLATHTAGLPRELGNPGRGTPHFTYPDYATRWRWLPNQKLRSVPGTQALYSNVGFDLLGDALQAAAKTPYPRLLAERTLGPLHMPNTTYFPTTQQCALLLVGVHDQGPCTVTEQTAGSSGLYSTAADMTIWLKYLLGTAEPAIPAQDKVAQDVYLAPEKLTRQIGLDHAGKPTGVGLGWIHVQPLDDPSHLVQKTGGGAGFTTYIAINPARKTAVFLARTEGLDSWKQNLFLAANDLVLQMAGLPPLPPPPPRAVVKKRVVKKPGKSVPVKKKAAPAGHGKRKAR